MHRGVKGGLYAAGGLAAAGALTACAWGAAGYAYARTRRPFLSEVAPELRSPALYWPGHLLPERGFIWLSRLINLVNPDRAYSADYPVDLDIVAGKSPEGHPFRARRLTPHAGRDTLKPAMLWTHGGGHLIGSAGFYDPQNARIAAELGMVVYAAEYRKSTEAPFPADLDDCYAVLRYMQDNARDLGIDPERIAVCGDSAGGGLAAGVVQRAHDAGHPVAFQGLVYPMIDHRTGQVGDVKAGSMGQFIWSPQSNRGAWAQYLGADHIARGEQGRLPQYASPARREDLKGLPRTWIGVGSIDLFHDESVAFARRLAEAGVPVDLEVYEGAYHGFEHIKPKAPQSRKLLTDFIAAVRTGVGA